jgi:hypothetical protein
VITGITFTATGEQHECIAEPQGQLEERADADDHRRRSGVLSCVRDFVADPIYQDGVTGRVSDSPALSTALRPVTTLGPTVRWSP